MKKSIYCNAEDVFRLKPLVFLSLLTSLIFAQLFLDIRNSALSLSLLLDLLLLSVIFGTFLLTFFVDQSRLVLVGGVVLHYILVPGSVD